MYPFNPKMGQKIQSNAAGVVCDRGFIAHFHLSDSENDTAATDGIIGYVTLADGETTTKAAVTLDHQPLCARVLSVTGNGATATGDVVITGKDIAGATITETIASTGAGTVLGTKAFAFVDSVVFPARTAEADAIKVGTSDKFGIPYLLPYNTVLAIYNNKTATTVAAGSFSETTLCLNHLDPTAALGGSDIDVYLIV